jgi:hypothetical protein
MPLTRLGAVLLAMLAAAACDDRHTRPMTAEEVGDELSHLRIAPGEWILASDVVEVHATGLPREVRNRMIGPRSRLRHCITPQQAARPSANFLAARADRSCTYRNFRVRDGRVSGAMTCPDTWTTMQGRYGPEGYDLRMDVATQMPNKVVMTVKVRSRGRRIGACVERNANRIPL